MKVAIRTLVLTVLILLVYVTGDAQTPFEVNYNAVRGTVVFIYQKGANGQALPDGTAFLIAVPSKANPTRSYAVLVTARHMVDPVWLGLPHKRQRTARSFQ